MQKYLILTASYWNWHNTAKDNIKAHLEEKWEQVQVIDLVTFLAHKWWRSARKFYEFSEKLPMMWDITFNVLGKEIVNDMIDLYCKSFSQKWFDKMLTDYNPDYIICTFPIWQYFIKNYIKKHKKTFKVWVVITDAIEVVTAWYYYSEKVVDYFFTIDEETKHSFIKRYDHKENNIFSSFFPIQEKHFVNKLTISNKRVYFLLFGWLGKEYAEKLINEIKNKNFFEEFVIIKWRNPELFDELKEKFGNHKRIKFEDYFDIKWNLKNIDIMITKPGWAIMSECIAADIFMFCPKFTPGQEEWNIKLIEKNKIWIFEQDAKRTAFLLEYLDFNKFLPNFYKLKNEKSIEFILEKMKWK